MHEVRLNSRVRFQKGGQRRFLEDLFLKLNMNSSELANYVHVCDRTVRDWRREKYNMPFSFLLSACCETGMPISKNIEILPPYWSVAKASRMGGERYAELYGPPGCAKSRRKGGLKSQEKLRLDPERKKMRAFATRKKISIPKQSPKLAEFIGIMLGDGSVCSDYQITVSFNPKVDLNYAHYIQKLITDLFSITSTIKIREKSGSGDVVASGRNLVEFLFRMGIRKGNKVANQIDIPKWIQDSQEYKKACLRGLIDTDGGFFRRTQQKTGFIFIKKKRSINT